MDVEKILKKLISFPTNTQKYDNNIKSFILNLLQDFNKEIIDIPDTDERCFVVKLKAKRGSKKPIAFLCHLDTVIPSNSWAAEPYEAVISRDKVIGLGASDMKGSIASLIKAIIDLKVLERDIVLIFTSDEETTVKDIKKVKRTIKLKNSLIIATEPTSGNLIVGQKGVLEIKVSTFGKSLHASNADFFENKKNSAIYKMLQVMQEVKNQEKDFSKKVNKNYGASTINMGKIYGGSAVNVMPDKCSLELSYRLDPQVDIDAYYSQIVSRFKKIDSFMKIELLLTGGSFDSSKIASVDLIKRLVEKTQGKASFEYGKIWSEIAEISRNNICLILGPGSPLQAHQANEYIDIKSLRQFCQIYSDMILDA